MQGVHLTADLRGCPATQPAMADPAALRALCLQSVAAAGLLAVGDLFHRFPAPGGVTGVVLLAESHLAVHTWPELGAVTLDVYVCNLQSETVRGPKPCCGPCSRPSCQARPSTTACTAAAAARLDLGQAGGASALPCWHSP